jgi:tetratricopeptide (TPR) repeat protein
LFLQRARQARVGFTLAPEDWPAVLRICQLVEGLPLGIELAAAWVLSLSCQEIANEIERNLNFLATFTRDIPERQRSISAVFDHSWKLISAEEQRVLRQLSVFQGGFGREAAEQVVNASLPLLSTLVSKSLLRRADPRTGRYDLHELVRQYALSHLQKNEQEYIQIREHHCRYYIALLERRGMALKGADRPAVVAELVGELANLRLAWNWAASHQHSELLSLAAETLFWLYESRSNCREGVPLFGQAVQSLQANESLAATPPSDIAWAQRLALGQALNYQGFFCFRQGQHPQGRDLLQHSLRLLRTLADADVPQARLALSEATAFLGTVTSVMGDYSEGRRLLYESLSLKQALEDQWGAAFCLRQLGLAAYYLGDYAEAHHLLTESLAISRKMKNTWAIAASLNALSTAAYAQGAYEEAQQLFQEALALSQSLEDRYNIAVGLNGLGLVTQALGQEMEAQHFFQESIALWREIGDQGSLAQTLNNLGDNLLALGDSSGAHHRFVEALAIARETQVIPVALEALLGLAHLRLQEGAVEPALELVSQVLQHPASTQEAKNRAAGLAAEIRNRLPSTQVAAIQTRVQIKNFEAVIRELLRL